MQSSVVKAQDAYYGIGQGPPILPHGDDPEASRCRHDLKKKFRESMKVDSSIKKRKVVMTEPPSNMAELQSISEEELKKMFPASALPAGFPPELAYRAMAAYSTIRTLSITLRLSPFTPNVFLRALYLPTPNRLLGHIHVAIMRILLGALHMGYYWPKQHSSSSQQSAKAEKPPLHVTKKRKVDGVRWPLRAGDNLEYLDHFTWPLFFDDYAHLTADIHYASWNDEENFVDVKNFDVSMVESDLLEDEKPKPKLLSKIGARPRHQQQTIQYQRPGPETIYLDCPDSETDNEDEEEFEVLDDGSASEDSASDDDFVTSARVSKSAKNSKVQSGRKRGRPPKNRPPSVESNILPVQNGNTAAVNHTGRKRGRPPKKHSSSENPAALTATRTKHPSKHPRKKTKPTPQELLNNLNIQMAVTAAKAEAAISHAALKQQQETIYISPNRKVPQHSPFLPYGGFQNALQQQQHQQLLLAHQRQQNIQQQLLLASQQQQQMQQNQLLQQNWGLLQKQHLPMNGNRFQYGGPVPPPFLGNHLSATSNQNTVSNALLAKSDPAVAATTTARLMTPSTPVSSSNISSTTAQQTTTAPNTPIIQVERTALPKSAPASATVSSTSSSSLSETSTPQVDAIKDLQEERSPHNAPAIRETVQSASQVPVARTVHETTTKEQKVTKQGQKKTTLDLVNDFVFGKGSTSVETGAAHAAAISVDDDDNKETNVPSKRKDTVGNDGESLWLHFRGVEMMRAGIPYHRLPLEMKLDLLEFLIDDLLSLDYIGQEMNRRQDLNGSYPEPYGLLPLADQLEELENEDYCAICRKEGDLLCCDGCPSSLHRECVGMARHAPLPEGSWYCPECKQVDSCKFGPLDAGRKSRLEWFGAPPRNLPSDSFEYMVVQGFLFRRPVNSGNQDPMSVFGLCERVPELVSRKHLQQEMLRNFGPDLMASWPLVQLPCDKSMLWDQMGKLAKPNFSNAVSFDPNLYKSLYCGAPMDGILRRVKDAQFSSYEQQCYQLSTLTLSSRLSGIGMEADDRIVDRLEIEVYADFGLQLIRGYMNSVEKVLSRSCLLRETWSVSAEGRFWASNVSSCTTINGLARILISLVDSVHPRAFLDSWFESTTTKRSEETDKGNSPALRLTPMLNPAKTLAQKRNWERALPGNIRSLIMREGKKAADWIASLHPESAVEQRSHKRKGARERPPGSPLKLMSKQKQAAGGQGPILPAASTISAAKAGVASSVSLIGKEEGKPDQVPAETNGKEAPKNVEPEATQHQSETKKKNGPATLDEKKMGSRSRRKRTSRASAGDDTAAATVALDERGLNSSIQAEMKKKLACISGIKFDDEVPHWPVAGRTLFDPVGRLPVSATRRLARRGGCVHAPFVLYSPQYEVGQCSMFHVWRKRAIRCHDLAEFLILCRMLASSIDSSTVQRASSIVKSLNRSSLSPSGRIEHCQRDVRNGEHEYLVVDNQSRWAWASSREIDLEVLIADRYKRRQKLVEIDQEVQRKKRMEELAEQKAKEAEELAKARAKHAEELRAKAKRAEEAKAKRAEEKARKAEEKARAKAKKAEEAARAKARKAEEKEKARALKERARQAAALDQMRFSQPLTTSYSVSGPHHSLKLIPPLPLAADDSLRAEVRKQYNAILLDHNKAFKILSQNGVQPRAQDLDTIRKGSFRQMQRLLNLLHAAVTNQEIENTIRAAEVSAEAVYLKIMGEIGIQAPAQPTAVLAHDQKQNVSASGPGGAAQPGSHSKPSISQESANATAERSRFPQGPQSHYQASATVAQPTTQQQQSRPLMEGSGSAQWPQNYQSSGAQQAIPQQPEQPPNPQLQAPSFPAHRSQAQPILTMMPNYGINPENGRGSMAGPSSAATGFQAHPPPVEYKIHSQARSAHSHAGNEFVNNQHTMSTGPHFQLNQTYAQQQSNGISSHTLYQQPNGNPQWWSQQNPSNSRPEGIPNSSPPGSVNTDSQANDSQASIFQVPANGHPSASLTDPGAFGVQMAWGPGSYSNQTPQQRPAQQQPAQSYGSQPGAAPNWNGGPHFQWNPS